MLESYDIRFKNTNQGIEITSNSSPPLEFLVLAHQETHCKGRVSMYTYYCKILGIDGTECNDIEIPEAVFLNDDMEWLFKKLGMTCAGSDANMKLIFDVLKQSVFNALQHEIYDHTGWLNDDGELCFVFGNKRVSGKGMIQIENKQASTPLTDITAKDSCSFIRDEYLELLNCRVYAKIMLCFEVLSLLKPILAKYGQFPRFSLYIYGITGCGKTSFSFPALNPFDMSGISINDSNAAAMQIIHDNTCSVTILDDLKSTKNKNSAMILENILRIASDKNTSIRRKIGNRIVEVNMNNLAAVTAEIEPPVQTSSFPRLIILSFDRSTVNIDKLKAMEQNESEFKRNNIAFLLHFLEHALTTPDFIRDFHAAFEDEIQCQRNLHEAIHGRYCETLAWMLTAWRTICTFCSHCGCSIDEYDFETHLTELILNQDKKYSTKSAAFMYCTALFDLVRCGKVKIVSDKNRDKVTVLEIIAKDGIWQIRSGTVFAKVQRYYADKEIDFNFTERYVRGELLRCGLISKSNTPKTQTTSDRRIQGQNFSYMSLRPGAARDFIKEQEGKNESDS